MYRWRSVCACNFAGRLALGVRARAIRVLISFKVLSLSLARAFNVPCSLVAVPLSFPLSRLAPAGPLSSRSA